MTTARTVITDALKEIGVGGQSEDIEHEEMNDSLRKLNQMLSLWSIEGLTIPYMTITTLSDGSGYTSGSSSYTIAATSADITLERPNDINAIQLLLGNDVIDVGKLNRDEWDSRLTHSIYPCGFWYHDTYPTATVYFDGTLPAGYDLRLTTDQPLGTLTLDAEISLPPEYLILMTNELAIRLIPQFEADVSERSFFVLTQAVENAKMIIQRNNAETGDVDLDPAVMGVDSCNYDYSRRLF